MVRTFALIIGIIYLLVGIMGFIPSLVSAPTGPDLVVHANHGRLLGLFPVNLTHNLVHLAIGVWALAASRSFSGSVGFARGLTVLYGLLAIMGLIPGLNTMFGLAPLHGNDVWLHAGPAAVAAYFGWVAARRDAPADTGTHRHV
ncbi:DUF4383 domain-containing protein [Deinococcus maricopensis]|uniref:DUF4383 domain-containing protein n=1 Tax=Deinococcus maricopensis (strain DSM 21211 / LMG 22137 / NRRL B-23946 / LB-34) TaxID=709986 RepID=E8U5K4_DEIML|nr:DUF4383 domain-containing protein [Deinococcus maricopensis]ADV66343.1 hypothetical protein Deima_0686 [Deinococcus maricopensis DSM 21211]